MTRQWLDWNSSGQVASLVPVRYPTGRRRRSRERRRRPQPPLSPMTTTTTQSAKGRRRPVPAARNPWPTRSATPRPQDRAPMPYYGFLAELNDRNVPGRQVDHELAGR